MNLKFFHFSIILVILYCKDGSSQGVDCNKKSFLCTSTTTFLNCEPRGTEYVTINNDPQACQGGLFCNGADDYECSSFAPPTTTLRPTTPKPTTRKPTTPKPTTRKPTTPKPTTRKPTTPKPTTRKPTTPKPTTPKPTTPKPQCPAAGKIPNPSVPNCKGYILCVGFIKLQLTCPVGSFDPSIKCCSRKYVCPGSLSPKCTSVGRIPNPDVTGCKGYILCAKILGKIYETKYTCTSNYRFNPVTKQCSNSYVCPPLPTTRKPTTMRPTTPPFVCQRKGIYPNPAVAGCRGYIQCIPSFGGLIPVKYLCKFNLVFNPVTRLCVLPIFYTCRA